MIDYQEDHYDCCDKFDGEQYNCSCWRHEQEDCGCDLDE